MENRVGLKLKTRVVRFPEVNRRFLPGELGAVLDWQVRDKNGKIVARGARKSESFTRQFMELLMVKMTGAAFTSSMQARDTGNVMQHIFDAPQVFGCDAPINNVDYGIIIGSGTLGPTIDDYAIQAIIPDADMEYSAVTFGAPAADPFISQFTITRNFANRSGAPQTVNEIALYVRARDGTWRSSWMVTGTFRYYMTIRDVLSPGIVVDAGLTLTVNYRPQVVV